MRDSPQFASRPPKSRRGRVLDLLRAAGEAGVSLDDFFRVARIPCPNVHIESLRFEGLVITRIWDRGRPRWVLAQERWFDAEEEHATRQAA